MERKKKDMLGARQRSS